MKTIWPSKYSHDCFIAPFFGVLEHTIQRWATIRPLCWYWVGYIYNRAQVLYILIMLQKRSKKNQKSLYK